MEIEDPISRNIKKIFNLRLDCDEAGTVETIRTNVDFHGANAWTLVFAIFVASIGLNMNSAAVIIGAMLISPLMGPILGFGLALGINDGDLFKRSLRNLSIAVAIAVLTSTIYFLLSPIHDAQSELLARTQPTFYDVMIAFFGGAAGIVSISRRERGQAVAGVAIATALMPPLCTAGYALSGGNLKFLAAALYLFLINSVFIALSTYIFVRYMKFQVVRFQDKEGKTKVRRWITVIVVVMILPSLVLAWSLLQESRFKLNMDRFLREQFHFKNSFIVDERIRFSHRKPKVEINVVGQTLNEDQISGLEDRLASYGLPNVEFNVHQLTQKESENLPTSALEAEIATLRQKISEQTSVMEKALQVKAELAAISSGVSEVLPAGNVYYVVWQKRAPKATTDKVEAFLKVRLKSEEIKVVHLIRT